MREELRCALNGKDILELDPRIYIQDIEDTIKVSPDTSRRAHYGLTLLSPLAHESYTVTVRFMIKEKRRVTRSSIIQRVNAWAKQGWLTISPRPFQRLYVYCTQPANAKAFSWSEDLSLVFTAYDESYWQDIDAAKAVYSGSDGSVSIAPGGSRPCFLEASIENASESTVQSLALSANGRTMAFEGLNLGAGEVLDIRYDEQHRMLIGVGSASKLGCRTGASADDILLHPGANSVGFTADHDCEVTLTARGEYD